VGEDSAFEVDIMGHKTEQKQGARIFQLITAPALISLAVTLLRLTGEMLHWSPRWFSTATGGIIPSDVSWVVGITWLALPFGVYFALQLLGEGRGPRKTGSSAAVALAGVGFVLAGLLLWQPPIEFPRVLIYAWLVMTAGAVVQFRGWPELAGTLAAYGLAARVPVVVVMFLAMWGDWGTHYDYVGMPPEFQMPFWPRFLWLALFPQLVFWVGFTVVAGGVAGSLSAAIVALRNRRKLGP